MKRNRKATLIAGLILSMTMAFSAPLASFGAEGAATGETGYSEDAQYSEAEESIEEGYSGEEEEAESEETVKTYTVTYSMNGHGDSWEEEVEEGSTAVDWSETPEAEGYTFTGWYTDSSCDEVWDSSAAISSDIKVYAGWEKVQDEETEESEESTESKTEESKGSAESKTGEDNSGNGSSSSESSEDTEKTTVKKETSSGDSELTDDSGTNTQTAATPSKSTADSSSSAGNTGSTASTGSTTSTGSTADTASTTDSTVTGTIATNPQSVSVEYPAGASFTVAAAKPSKVKSYQWYLYDKSSKKSIQLDGTTATKSTLVIPSTTKEDNGRIYYCRLKFTDGTTADSGQAVLTISNKNVNKPVLYVGNYAINPGETLFISGKDISTENAEEGSETVVIDGETYYTFNSITFDSSKKVITFRNVHISNSRAQYDHKYSPAVGVRLVVGKNEVEQYTIKLVGENQIGIAKVDSEIDDDGSALRFDFDDAKKTPEVMIEGTGTLKTISGKTAVVCDGDLGVASKVTISPKKGDTVSNGIEAENLTLYSGAVLTANAYGTCAYVHDKLYMKSGSKAEMQAITSNSPAKEAALYTGEEVELAGGALKIAAGAGSGSSVSTFSALQSGGDVNLSDGSTLLIGAKTPGTVYGVRASGKLSLEDSHMQVTAESSDKKGKVFGVLCGSSLIKLAKEKVYTVKSVATDGIGFAALTGKSGSSEQKYQESYTPEKIKFDNAGVVVPSSYSISTGSFKDSSKYKYIETVYDKNSTTAPAESVRFDSNSHEWGDPVYTWSSDYKTVTATITCKNYSAHVQSETVTTTSKQTKAATCTAKGQTTYTATFENSAFETQTKTVENIAVLGHKYGDWTVTTKPTLTSTGIKKRTCSTCGYVESQTVPKLEKGTYKVKKGESLSWTKNSSSSLEVKIERTTDNSTAFSHFQGVLVDGKVLNKKYYSAKSGSVIIKFKSDFLSKLGVGTHTLTYGFEDGDNPSSKLVIKAASTSSSSSSSSSTTKTTAKSAKTGDTTNILVWVLTLCAAGVAVVLIQRYKKKNKSKSNGSDSAK